MKVTFVLKKVMTFQNGTCAQQDYVRPITNRSSGRGKTMLASPGKKTVFDVTILKINRCPYKAGGGKDKKIYIRLS